MEPQDQADPVVTGADPATAAAEDAAFDEVASAADAKSRGAPAEQAEPEPEESTTSPDEGEPPAPKPPAPNNDGEPAADTDAQGENFWTEVEQTHPRAEQDIEDPRFKRFIEADKRIARMALSKAPAVAVELLNLYYEARDAGELDGQPAADQPKTQQIAATPPTTGPEKIDLDAFSDVVVSDANGQKRTIAQIRDEAGDEYIATIAAVANKILQQTAQQAPQAQPPAEMAELRHELAVMRFWDQLDGLHDGAKRIAVSPECKTFVAAQPPSIQRLYRSDDPADVAYVLGLFTKNQDEAKNAQARGKAVAKKTRTDALHSETVRGQGRQATASTEPDDQDEDAWFDKEANKAETRMQARRKVGLR